MRKYTKLFWTAFLVALIFNTAPVHSKVSSLSVTKDELTKLAAAVSEAAGYKFKNTPVVEMVDGARIKKNFSEEEVFFTQTWRARGFNSTGFAVKHSNFYGEYSWVKKKIYLAGDTIQAGAKTIYLDAKVMKKMLLIHELAHALDDQYYGLKNILSAAPSEESVLIYIATIEAHAYLVAQRVYASLGFRQLDIDAYMKAEKAAKIWPLYAKGMDFLKLVVEKTKRPLKELFEHLPVNAEELLSPDKYLTGGATAYHSLKRNLSNLASGLPWYFGNLVYTELPQLDFFLNSRDFGLPEEVVRGVKLKTTMVYYNRLDGDSSSKIPLITTSSPKQVMDFDKGALIIDIYELVGQANVKGVMGYYSSLLETFKAANFYHREIDFSYLCNRFSDIYITDWSHREFGEVLDCLVLLKGNYLVEICAMNLQIREEELLQILDQIGKRL